LQNRGPAVENEQSLTATRHEMQTTSMEVDNQSRQKLLTSAFSLQNILTGPQKWLTQNLSSPAESTLVYYSSVFSFVSM